MNMYKPSPNPGFCMVLSCFNRAFCMVLPCFAIGLPHKSHIRSGKLLQIGRVGKVAEAAAGVASVLWWASDLKMGDGFDHVFEIIPPKMCSVWSSYCHIVHYIPSHCMVFVYILYDIYDGMIYDILGWSLMWYHHDVILFYTLCEVVSFFF